MIGAHHHHPNECATPAFPKLPCKSHQAQQSVEYGANRKFSGHLLDQPEDVLKAILRALRFGRSAVNPFGGQADVASFARCSKAANAAAWPILYHHIQLTRLSILERLHHTLTSRPDRAAGVRYLSVAPTFIDYNQVPMGFSLSTMKIVPRSMVTDLPFIKMHGKQLTHRLIATWFACLAEQTPNLRGIDASPIGFISTFFIAGFAGLAPVLRRRRAWYKSCPTEFFTLIAVDEPARPNPMVAFDGSPSLPARVSPFGVSFIDFGRQVMDVSNMIDPDLFEQTCATRFSELVPVHEQPQWKIRHVDYSEPHRALDCSAYFNPRAAHIAEQLTGVNPAKDHHFKLSHVTGNVSANALLPEDIPKFINSIQPKQPNVLPHMVLSQYECFGRRFTPESKTAVQALLNLSPTSPWINTTRLSLKDTFYITSSTIDGVLMSVATSMPNLIAISFEAVKATLPEILTACDALIRRMPEQGRALEDLCVMDPSPTSVLDPSRTSAAPAPRRTPKTRSRAKLPPPPPPAPPKPKPTLSPLPQTHRGSTRLRRLIIEWPQAQPHVPNRLRGILIHPGLLHSIQTLSVASVVPLDIAAPDAAQPDSPSFTSYALNAPPVFLKIGHVHLPNLVALKLDTQFIEPLRRSRDGFVASLPHAPNLLCLMALRIPMPMAAECDTVIDTVAKYPKLTTASFSQLMIDTAGLRKVIQSLLVPATSTLDRLLLVNRHKEAPYIMAGGRQGQFQFNDFPVPQSFTFAPEVKAQALPKGARCKCGPGRGWNIVKSAIMLDEYICDTCDPVDYHRQTLYASNVRSPFSDKWEPGLRMIGYAPEEESAALRLMPAKEWGLVEAKWECGRETRI